MTILSHAVEAITTIKVPLMILLIIILALTYRTISWSPAEKILLIPTAIFACLADEGYSKIFDIILILLEAVLIILSIFRLFHRRE